MSIEEFISEARAMVADHSNRVLEEVKGVDGKRHTVWKISDRSHFVMLARQRMIQSGMAEPGEFQTVDQKDLRDFRSMAFLEMIFDSEIRNLRNKALWLKEAESPHLIRAFPAIEWLPSAGFGESCRAIWSRAGGTFHDVTARMIAPKFDPIWAEISAFGVPWSTEWVDGSWIAASVSDVSRSQLEDLGLIYEPRGWVAGSIEALDARERSNNPFREAVLSMDPETKRRLLKELRGGPKPRNPEEAGRAAAAAVRGELPSAAPLQSDRPIEVISPPWEWGWSGYPLEPEAFRNLNPLFPLSSFQGS